MVTYRWVRWWSPPPGSCWPEITIVAKSALTPTAHAELLALREATRGLPGWRLEGATVYVTLEPCAMCAGAMVNARIARLVFGALDPKAGAVVSLFQIGTDARLNHRFDVVPGFMAEEGGRRLSQFFAELRRRRQTST